MEQPYIPPYMKKDFTAMSLGQLIDLVHWECLPHEYFSECKTKEDYVTTLKRYINITLNEQRIRKEGIIDRQKELEKELEEREERRKVNKSKKKTVLRKRELKRLESKTVADYELLCQLYEELFSLSSVPADRYTF